MTTCAFTDDRCVDVLPIVSVHDTLTGYYTAWYVDMPWLVTQVEDKAQARERLKDAFVCYIKSICKR
jgi:predicted RNase H-like HicB family nuclease